MKKVIFDTKSRGCYGPRPDCQKWKLALCKIGLHIFGGFEHTRYNPAMNFDVYHCFCACGLCQSMIKKRLNTDKKGTNNGL